MTTRRKKKPREVTAADAADPDFEVREGDKLFVSWGGGKVSLAGTFSSVDLPMVTITRGLHEGDDLAAEVERSMNFIENAGKRHAQAKLRWFADAVRSAEKRAKGRG